MNVDYITTWRSKCTVNFTTCKIKYSLIFWAGDNFYKASSLFFHVPISMITTSRYISINGVTYSISTVYVATSGWSWRTAHNKCSSVSKERIPNIELSNLWYSKSISYSIVGTRLYYFRSNDCFRMTY